MSKVCFFLGVLSLLLLAQLAQARARSDRPALGRTLKNGYYPDRPRPRTPTHMETRQSYPMNSVDSAALLDLIAAVPLARAAFGWSGQPTCSWENIRCDGQSPRQRVTLLGTFEHDYVNRSVELSGYFPSSLSNMAKLESLVFEGKFTGTIPNLSQSPNLEYIAITARGSMTPQTFPSWITSMPALFNVYFESCNLIGSIPTTINQLSDLAYLELDRNQLTGSFPNVRGLTNLWRLSLVYNQLSGSLPSWIGELALNQLSLHGNPFTGTIPASLANLRTMSTLGFPDCNFSGPFPSYLSTFTDLIYLDFDNSKLTGSLPSDIGNMAALETLHLSNNQLTGSLPTSIGNLRQLTTLYLGGNQFSGTIPGPQIGNMTKLYDLDLSRNNFTGAIPTNINSLTSLYTLTLGGNKLSGPVPTLSALTSLERLDLYSGKLNGSIPTWISSLSNLLYLDVSFNEFSGTLPSQLGSLEYLRALDVSNNKLVLPLPSAIWSLTSLALLNLGGLQLNSAIPTQLQSLTELATLRLEATGLQGSIPSWIGTAFPSMSVLALGQNNLSGSIPSQIGGLSGLTRLDLSNNNLSSTVPTTISQLPYLEYLDLSWNGLQGELSALAQAPSLTDCTVTENYGTCSGGLCCNGYAQRVPPTTTTTAAIVTVATTATTATTGTATTVTSATAATVATSSATAVTTATTATSAAASSITSSSATTTTTTSGKQQCTQFEFACVCSSDLSALRPTVARDCDNGIWRINSPQANNGTISIGIPDTVIISGAFQHNKDSITNIYANETAHGSVIVEGPAQLSGKLSIMIEGGMKNTTIQVLNATFVNGTFDKIEVIDKATGCKYRFTPEYTPTAVLVYVDTPVCKTKSNNRMIIIIAASVSVGAVLIIAVIIAIIFMIVKFSNPFSTMFKKKLRRGSKDDLYRGSSSGYAL